MIKVSIMYPNSPGARFDHQYYRQTHMAMVEECLGSACCKIEVEKGLDKDVSGIPCTYIAACHLYFDSLENFRSSFGPHGKTLAADVANYTDLKSIMQVNEVVS